MDTSQTLSPAARWMLAEASDDRGLPWELRWMSSRYYLPDEAFDYGPGVLVEDPRERLASAQDAAVELLEAGLVRVHTGPDPFEEGVPADVRTGRGLLSEEAMWRPPDDPARPTYVWLVLTPDGERVLETATFDDIPRIQLPPPRPAGRASTYCGQIRLRLLLRLLAALDRLERRLARTR